MSLKKAIEVLKIYNAWRLGNDGDMLDTKLITEAIQVVIKEYEKR
jgi:hypothetical protein